MSVLTIAGLVGGLLSAGYGAWKQSKAAKEEQKANSQLKAAQQAWYDRNYYQDYLNTVEAQNALKRVRNAWDERVREARARQVISGGTPAQLAAVQEAGAEAMGEAVGNLAAQGQQNRQAIDAQKLAMDNNLSQQAAQIAENKQAAGQQLMAGGASLITSGLQSFAPKANAPMPKADVTMTQDLASNFKDTSLELPKSIEPLNIDDYQIGLVAPNKKK